MTHDFLTTEPLKLDDEMIGWLGKAIRRQLRADLLAGGVQSVIETSFGPVKSEDLIEATGGQIEKAIVETRNRVAAAHAAGKRLGSGTWTGTGSVLELVDATNALAEVLP